MAWCCLWSTQVDNVIHAGDKLAEFKLKKAMEAVNNGKAQVSYSLVEIHAPAVTWELASSCSHSERP